MAKKPRAERSIMLDTKEVMGLISLALIINPDEVVGEDADRGKAVIYKCRAAFPDGTKTAGPVRVVVVHPND